MLGGQAQADEPKSGAASVGQVAVTLDGVALTRDPIAPCTTPGSNSTSAVTPVRGIVFGAATTSCTVDANTHEAIAKASGKRFKVAVLDDLGGPVIQLSSWSLECQTKGTGSTGSMSVSGVTGVTVPSSIPANYTVVVPAENAGDPDLAKVVFNELITPNPADGSMTLHLVHITLFPDTPDSPDHGDIVLGTVSCDPS